MFVDHYLQVALLARLANAGNALKFSEAKEAGIDNSLFMYHANKLIARKAITKGEDGFRLTALGARWINSVGHDMKHTSQTVRPLIQFVVRDNQDRLLVGSRKGQLKELLNDFMLPGGLHKSGMSADENAHRVAKNIFGAHAPAPHFLSVVESINVYGDGFIYHSLSHVYTLQLTEADFIANDDRFNFEWIPLRQIHANNALFRKSPFLPLFVAKLQHNRLQPREIFRIEYP